MNYTMLLISLMIKEKFWADIRKRTSGNPILSLDYLLASLLAA